MQPQELLRFLKKFFTEPKGCNYATYRHTNALLLSLLIHTHSTSSPQRLSLAVFQFHHLPGSFLRDTSSRSCLLPASQCLTASDLSASMSLATAGTFSLGTIRQSSAGASAVVSSGWGTSCISCHVCSILLASNVCTIEPGV